MRSRRTDDGTYPEVDEARAKLEERAAASRIQPRPNLAELHQDILLRAMKYGRIKRSKGASDPQIEEAKSDLLEASLRAYDKSQDRS